MSKVFITYSHLDEDFVDRLVNDLENSALDVVLDKKLLGPGDSLIEIFEQIGTSDFLLPILSPNSVDSNWVKKELSVAIIKEIEESEFKVIPVIKEECELPTGLREALRDKYKAQFDAKDYDSALKELLKKLTPDQRSSDLYATIQGPRSDNPFRRVRAEYFEDLQLLARSFSEPEKARYDRLIEVKPSLIEGGRGSGKTMVLKSQQAQVAVSRRRKRTFTEAGLHYFGIYCRCSQGSFATQSGAVLDKLGMDISTRVFTNEFLLKLVLSLVDELRDCSGQGIIGITAEEERTVSMGIAQAIRPTHVDSQLPTDLRALLRFLYGEIDLVISYIGRRILGEEQTYMGIFIDAEKLKQICQIVSTSLAELKDKTTYFLLDEYENLLPFQKPVVNTLIKWTEAGCFSVKVAAKKTAFDNPQTLEGQEIQESHDYSSLDIDYNISDEQQRKEYQSLLFHICRTILEQESFTETDVRKLLEPSEPWDGINIEEIERELFGMLRSQGVDLDELKEKAIREYWHRLGSAALSRVLRKTYRGRKKQFAGFNEFTLLSSGIIRYFLELCGMSYYFAAQDGINVKTGQAMSSAHQTEAAHALSSYYLSTLRKNIADVGPIIQQLVIDLGDIFRAKLLNHLSEPEASRLAIVNPQRLEEPFAQHTKRLLDTAGMHSVFQIPSLRGGMRPKHPSDVQPREYVLSRIYSPILQISVYARWRTNVTVEDIAGLFDPLGRKGTKSKLVQQVKRAVPNRPSLFEQGQGEVGDND